MENCTCTVPAVQACRTFRAVLTFLQNDKNPVKLANIMKFILLQQNGLDFISYASHNPFSLTPYSVVRILLLQN